MRMHPTRWPVVAMAPPLENGVAWLAQLVRDTLSEATVQYDIRHGITVYMQAGIHTYIHTGR